MGSRKKAITGAASGRAELLRYLKQVIEAGHYRPLIDRIYPLEQIVDAHAYVDTGRKRGNVVITMDRAAPT